MVPDIELVDIPGGAFRMGSDSAESQDQERPVHEVRVEAFRMAAAPVTQGQWEAVMGKNPSHFKYGKDHPVERVCWNDAWRFVCTLNERTGRRFRLPTEAEWEYACRAGTTGDRYGHIDEIAWHEGNSGIMTHPVKGKRPNAFGLYDMLGNVSEWTDDWYWVYLSDRADVFGDWSETHRVIRGGSCRGPAWTIRAPWRYGEDPGYEGNDVGLRLAMSLY